MYQHSDNSNLGFFYARHNHRLWVINLHAFILGLTNIQESDIISDKDCELHSWIENYVIPLHGKNSLVMELETLHKKAHSLYYKIFSSVNNNDPQTAKADYELLSKYSEEILQIMDQMR